MKKTQKYSTDESKPLVASEPEVAYGTAPRAARIPVRKLARQDDRCLTLEEFGCHLSNLIDNTHNTETGNVELSEVSPKKRSIAEIRKHSVTLEELYDGLQSMVDDFYDRKA